jgi:hypothetical protein
LALIEAEAAVEGAEQLYLVFWKSGIVNPLDHVLEIVVFNGAGRYWFN